MGMSGQLPHQLLPDRPRDSLPGTVSHLYAAWLVLDWRRHLGLSRL